MLPYSRLCCTVGINDSTIVHGVMPVIDQLAAKYRLKVIDLHTPLTGMKECFADHVHPNEKAAARIAWSFIGN